MRVLPTGIGRSNLAASHAYNGRLFHLILEGDYTTTEVKDQVARAVAEPEFPADAQFLMDVTRSTALSNRSATEIREMAEYLSKKSDRFGRRNARWYMWVPALGQLASVPLLVAFLLWPVDDVIPLPSFLALGGLKGIPVGFVFSVFGSILGSFFTAPFLPRMWIFLFPTWTCASRPWR